MEHCTNTKTVTEDKIPYFNALNKTFFTEEMRQFWKPVYRMDLETPPFDYPPPPRHHHETPIPLHLDPTHTTPWIPPPLDSPPHPTTPRPQPHHPLDPTTPISCTPKQFCVQFWSLFHGPASIIEFNSTDNNPHHSLDPTTPRLPTPPPLDPNHTTPWTPPPHNSFVYSFGHYSMDQLVLLNSIQQKITPNTPCKSFIYVQFWSLFLGQDHLFIPNNVR